VLDMWVDDDEPRCSAHSDSEPQVICLPATELFLSNKSARSGVVFFLKF
jgi:hypothetical protein